MNEGNVGFLIGAICGLALAFMVWGITYTEVKSSVYKEAVDQGAGYWKPVGRNVNEFVWNEVAK